MYAELYNEVYSAKDVVAAIHGSNEESKTGVTTSSVDDAVVVVDEDGTADSISNTVDNAAANSEHGTTILFTVYLSNAQNTALDVFTIKKYFQRSGRGKCC